MNSHLDFISVTIRRYSLRLRRLIVKYSFHSLLSESCVKIGEGVYGEVFKVHYENGESIALKVQLVVAFVDFIF